MRYKYYRKKHSSFGLAWSRLRTNRGLSRPISVFRKTIGVCKILSRSVEIWQYGGQNLFLSKNSMTKPMLRLGRSIDLAVNEAISRDLTCIQVLHFHQLLLNCLNIYS